MSGGRIYDEDFILSYGGIKAGPMMGFEYEISIDSGDLAYETYDIRQQRLRSFGILPSKFAVQYEGIGERDYGFEIKSPVANLETHKRLLPKLMSNFNFKQPMQVNESGIHINVSSQHHKQPVPFIRLVHKNRPLFKKASGRTTYSFNKYARSTGMDDYNEYFCIFSSRKSYAYEFRMFKAEPKFMLPALEMAAAVTEVCNELPNLHTLGMNCFMSKLRSSVKYKHAYKVMQCAHKGEIYAGHQT